MPLFSSARFCCDRYWTDRLLTMAMLFVGILSACSGELGDSKNSPRYLSGTTAVGASISFANNRSQYNISKNSSGGFAVSYKLSGDIVNVNSGSVLKFADVSINLAMGDIAATISSADLRSLIELYIAFFNRVPDAEGLAYWIAQRSNGVSVQQIADSFYSAGLQYSAQTGYNAAMSHADFVKVIYQNVLGRSGSSAPSDSEVNYWADRLTKGADTRSNLINTMLGAARGYATDPTWAWVTTLLDNKVSVGQYVAVDQGLTYLSATDSITKGTAIAQAVKPTSMALALALAGTNDNAFSLTLNVTANTMLGSFKGNVVLGSPTATSIKANVFAPDQSGTVWLAYGKTTGIYLQQSLAVPLVAGKPVEIALDKLSADTAYYYRLYYQPANSASSASSSAGPTEEYRFHTARPPGSTFTFNIQGDSHPERKSQFDSNLYIRTLQTAAADKPDFYLTSGDDFSVDTLDPATINAAQVTERYTIQRPYLGLIGNSAPVYLVNGNHEQAAGYLLNGTANNVAVWAQNARNSHYSQPATDGFYTGNTELVPYIGLLHNYYAWTWGDALFVVIDPYFPSRVPVDNVFGGTAKRANMWEITHGEAQYQWLKTTLEQSRAKYKFVFAHHVMGTNRGGVEVAKLWEWGGFNSNGVYEFATQRPTWVKPIHKLFVDNKVSIFFQGHDHTWVHQQLDGVTYQTLSEPADPFYENYYPESYLSGEKFPNTGYTRVKVSPTSVKVEYIRTYLPADEGPGKVSGTSVFSYTIP